jgi:hypothetical protein
MARSVTLPLKAAGRTDRCLRMADLQGFLPLRETGRRLVSFGKR